MSRATKPHIGIFGRRNAGKSSIINAIAGQDVAIVSDKPGTTTDPVKKAFEITGIGAVVFIDTAGIDDESNELGQKRIEASQKVFDQIDLALLVITEYNFTTSEEFIIQELEKRHTPYFIINNKFDLFIGREIKNLQPQIADKWRTDVINFSTLPSPNFENEREKLLDLVKKHLPESSFNNPSLLGDLVQQGDIVLLITPIDIEAPKDRLILPQIQTIRAALDQDCIVIMTKEKEVDSFLRHTKIEPKLAITDSQVFLKAAGSIPDHIPLTSFSILLARLKGDFEAYLKGTPAIGQLKDQDRVLILESCAHHVATDDIGRTKIPRWISNFTGKQLKFEILSGLNKPECDVKEYKLVIQCGGCMLTRKQILNRLKPFTDAGVPVSNYGMTIAYCHGIFDRAVKVFTKDSPTFEQLY